MDSNLSVGVLLTSVRDKRRGEAFARWILAALSGREGVSVELIDLRDWPLPPYPHDTTPPIAEKTYAAGTLSKQWFDKISALDAVVIVTPEYGHGYPGTLKNALDHIYTPWNYKPVAFVSYGGFAAGARAVEQLRLVAVELRMIPIRDEVNLSLIGLATDDQGAPTGELHLKRAATMCNELVWWARVIKEGRERHPR